MHDYLARLIGRATATTEVVRPLSVPRFARAAEHAPGDPLPAIDESEAGPASERGDATRRAQSSPTERESDSMRVVAHVASTDEGDGPRAHSPRRSPERIRTIDGLRPDGRSSVADAAPEPLASPMPAASEARVARSSDPPSRADDAEPAGDPAERRRHIVATRIADRDDAVQETVDRGAAHAADAVETRGPGAPADPRDESRRSSTRGPLGLDAGAAEDQRRLLASIDSRVRRAESAREPEPREPVRISIGRIDVTIATKEQSERRSEPTGPAAPLVSLDDYLARQGRQGRGGR